MSRYQNNSNGAGVSNLGTSYNLKSESLNRHPSKFFKMHQCPLNGSGVVPKDPEKVVAFVEGNLEKLKKEFHRQGIELPNLWKGDPSVYTEGISGLNAFKKDFNIDSMNAQDKRAFLYAFYITDTGNGINEFKENFSKIKKLYKQLECCGLNEESNKFFTNVGKIYTKMGRGNVVGMSSWIDSLQECFDKYSRGEIHNQFELSGSLEGFFVEARTIGKMVDNNLYEDKNGEIKRIINNIEIGSKYSTNENSNKIFAEIDAILTLSDGEKIAIEVKNKSSTFLRKNDNHGRGEGIGNQITRLGEVIAADKTINNFVVITEKECAETLLNAMKDLYKGENLPNVLLVLPGEDPISATKETAKFFDTQIPITMVNLLKTNFYKNKQGSVCSDITCLYYEPSKA